MKLTQKEALIVEFCKENDEISKTEAQTLLKPYYFFNHEKHTFNILSNLMKSKVLVRDTKGVYKISRHQSTEKKKQKNLFE